MNASEIDRLVSMANEIADNIAPGEDSAAAELATMNHLIKFWSPSLLEKIVQNYEQRVGDLQPVAAGAVRRLAEENK